jgi:hypothetical protein
LFYQRLNWRVNSQILDNQQRLAMSLWSASYGEVGDGRNERGSPQGVLGGC